MLPLVIDRESTVSLSAQIAAEIRRFVTEGALDGDEALPSSRRLAQQLGVARGTVVAAYDQLASEGYLVTRAGGATRIHPGAGARSTVTEVQAAQTSSVASERAPVIGNWRSEPGRDQHRNGGARIPESVAQVKRHPKADASVHIVDLRPHSRPGSRLDDPAWRESWRKAATAPETRSVEARAAAAAGLPDLRTAIAEHLRLMRAMVVDPDSIVVTGGARDGLALVLAGLGEAVAPVAVEAPGYPGLRRVLRRRGMAVAESPVDADGVIPSRLPPRARSVLLTPNHLFPVGGSMPATRRIELLRQSSARGLLVIEDDFDSDFRHVGAPVPTLRELDPDAVVHLGTFSQVLTADAGIGYVIAPDGVRDALIRAVEDLGPGAPAIAQRAVADFLYSGGLRRRITRRRRALIRRRDLLLQELAGHPVEMISGARAVVRLQSEREVRSVIERCSERGVLVGDLAGYWSGASVPSRAGESPIPASSEDSGGVGIVVQCADTSREDLLIALQTIRDVLDDV